MLEKLEAEIVELHHQRHLAGTLAIWCFLPLTLAIVLFMAAMIVNAPSYSPSRDPRFVAGFALFQGFFIVFAWAINRHAVRKRLDPRIAELEKLHRHLVSSEGQP